MLITIPVNTGHYLYLTRFYPSIPHIHPSLLFLPLALTPTTHFAISFTTAALLSKNHLIVSLQKLINLGIKPDHSEDSKNFCIYFKINGSPFYFTIFYFYDSTIAAKFGPRSCTIFRSFDRFHLPVFRILARFLFSSASYPFLVSLDGCEQPLRACVRACCVRRVASRARARLYQILLPLLVSCSGGSSACSPECSIRPAPKFSTPRIRGERRRARVTSAVSTIPLHPWSRDVIDSASFCAIRLEIRGSQWRGRDEYQEERKKVGQLLSEIIFPTPKMVGFNFKLGPWTHHESRHKHPEMLPFTFIIGLRIGIVVPPLKRYSGYLIIRAIDDFTSHYHSFFPPFNYETYIANSFEMKIISFAINVSSRTDNFR